MVTVISLGGSIIAPDGVDEGFLKDFRDLVRDLFAADEKLRLILVTGGGGPARAWQRAYRSISGGGGDEEADWIGIMATRLNAQLVKAVMGEWCTQEVATNPTQVDSLAGRILVAAGWKPGFSSDYDAVLLAERFQADRLINLSNIDQVYTDDPRKNPQAKPIDAISWADFRALVGDAWRPGLNLPFDPVASRHAAKIGLQVVCAGGRDLANLKKLFRGEPFLGTVIG
ncbi:MAG: UMP kinase [Treponema sp.]|jgi:uridylate kinase|nr:UMP kinase [Treponema sp.]